MRAFRMVLEKLSPHLPPTMRGLRESLLETLGAALRARHLSLVEVGQQLPGNGSLKAKVKTLWRRWRQLGQPEVLRVVWRAIAHALLTGVARPVLLVDWSALNEHAALLCCTVAHQGRALPIYFEVHPAKAFGTPAIEHAFLRTLLRDIVPACQPVVCADAGFRSPWFDEVVRLGADYLGRLGPKVLLQSTSSSCDLWVSAELIGLSSGPVPQEMGPYRVCKGKPVFRRVVRCRRVPVRAFSQKRGPSKGHNSKEEKHRRMAEMGYVLVTSLPSADVSAAHVVALYDRRMQLEELLRSLKSERYGLGANASLSHAHGALAALWLTGALMCIALHCAGSLAYHLGWHTRYQTNTTSDRRVLSTITLGRLVLLHHDQRALTPKRLHFAFSQIPQLAQISAAAA